MTIRQRQFLAAGAATVTAIGTARWTFAQLVAGFSDGVVTTPVGGYGLVSMKGR